MTNNTKRILPRLSVVVGLAALGFLLFVPDTAQAQGPVLFACYVPNSGVVYRVNPPGSPGQSADLKDACTGEKHILFSWSQVGPQGVPGLSGYERVEGATVTVAPNTLQVATAVCPTGKKVLGGGYIFPGGAFSMELTSSRPDSDDTWAVFAQSEVSSNVTMKAFAVCAFVAP